MKKQAKQENYSVTSAGVNPAADRTHRQRVYFTAMTLRVLCVLSLLWVRDWWVLLSLAGAAILPWFAVMVGNAVAHTGESQMDAATPLELAQASGGVDAAAAAAPSVAGETIVIDVEPTRRGTKPRDTDQADVDADTTEDGQ